MMGQSYLTYLYASPIHLHRLKIAGCRDAQCNFEESLKSRLIWALCSAQAFVITIDIHANFGLHQVLYEGLFLSCKIG